MYNKSILNEIRDRITMSALIGERMPLKRAGRSFKGLCPFHSEKTPSFNVSDERGIYHCFGCGEGGDAFQFLMKFEGLSFSEAVEALAAKAGVTLPKNLSSGDRAEEDAKTEHRRGLLRINKIAMKYFQATLASKQRGGAVLGYLKSRGIGDKNITQHFLGYAEDSWEGLLRHLEAQKVPSRMAAELGLVKERQGGGCYDFFRHRIIFPILSAKGDVLGFGGRYLEGGKEKEKGSKYLNSPDSAIYHKSNCVYGLDRSAAAIRSKDQVILVEGYMDFIALYDAGIENVAAPLGTALTQGHISLLRRMTQNMVIVFDGDDAGQRACLRALPLFVEEGLAARVVVLPKGDDPDTFVRREGGQKFQVKIDSAKPLFEHFVEKTIEETGLDSAGKLAAISRVIPFLQKVSDPVGLSVLRQYVSRRMDVDDAEIAKMLKRAGKDTNSKSLAVLKSESKAPLETDAERAAEKLLIAAMISDPAILKDVFAEIGPASFLDEWCNTAALLIWKIWQDAADKEKINVSTFIDSCEDEYLASQLRAMAVKGVGAEDEDDLRRLVSDCVSRIANRPSVARMEAINDDIKRAESDGDEEKLFALLSEKKELVGKMKAVN